MKTMQRSNQRTSLSILWMALATLGLTVGTRAADAPPERMTYQGFLVDGNGTALGNASPENFDVIFRIFVGQTGGDPLWAEQQTITVDKGYFSVLLGEGGDTGLGELRPDLSTVFAGPDASDRYIGISVKDLPVNGTNLDILPRLKLVSSPYAYLAARAVSVANNAIGSDQVAIDSLTASDLAANSVGSSEVVDNSLTANDLGAGSVGSSEVSDNSLTANDLAANSVGNSELASNPKFDGYVGVNQLFSDVTLTVRDGGGHSWVILAENSSGGDLFSVLPNGSVAVNGNVLTVAGKHVPNAEERLRIVRGAGTANTTVGGSNSPIYGSGFTYTKISQGVVDVSFNTSFSGIPTVTANPISAGAIFCGLENLSTSGFRIVMYDTGNSGRDWPFNFIAVGPR